MTESENRSRPGSERRTRRSGTANTTPGRQPRTPIADLPPDRQAEIVGNRNASRAQRRNTYRPQIPEVQETIEIHTSDVNVLFVRHFEACNQYAVAIDYVARERLTDRSEFNAYLAEFDALLEELTQKTRELYAVYEELSGAAMTTNRAPTSLLASVQSRRSLQLLRQFKSADDILRMMQFVHIYGNLDDAKMLKDSEQVSRELARCVRGLRAVKVRCFRRIIELEQLRIENTDGLSIEELEVARSVARSRPSTPPAPRRRRRPDDRIDPAAPALAEIPGQAEEETSLADAAPAEPLGGSEETIAALPPAAE